MRRFETDPTGGDPPEIAKAERLDAIAHDLERTADALERIADAMEDN